VNEALRRLQEEGYGLIILFDRRRDAGNPDARDLRFETVTARERRSLAELSSSLTAARKPSQAMPVFQINGGDLAFLKSIGIDPTRRARGRRGAKRRPDTAADGDTDT